MSNYGDQYGGQPGNDPYGQNPYGQNPYGQNPYGQNPYGGPPAGGPFGAPPVDPSRQPLRGATIGEAYSRFWKKYAEFHGRASRSEFWWTALINWVIGIVLNVLERDSALFALIAVIWGLATIVPSLALGARRLHDTNRSAWWLLLYLLPIVGWIILIVFWAMGPKPEGARFDAA